MTTERAIFERLHWRSLGWNGGKTSFVLAAEIGRSLSTVRAALRRMDARGIVEACAPYKQDRMDGRTAATLIWFRATSEFSEV